MNEIWRRDETKNMDLWGGAGGDKTTNVDLYRRTLKYGNAVIKSLKDSYIMAKR